MSNLNDLEYNAEDNLITDDISVPSLNSNNNVSENYQKQNVFAYLLVSILIGTSWSLAAVYTSDLEKTFSQPFFLTYFHAFSTMICCLILLLIYKAYYYHHHNTINQQYNLHLCMH